MKLSQGVGVVELSGRHALFLRENLPVIFSLTFDNRLAAWGRIPPRGHQTSSRMLALTAR